jgi:hypothetical protein
MFVTCEVIQDFKILLGDYLYDNIMLSMLYAEICPKVRRHNARPGRDIFRHITWTTQYYCYYYSECLW